MIIFNSEGKESVSFQDAIIPAMGITEEREAKQYAKHLTSYIESRMDKTFGDVVNAEQVALNTIAYVASKTREGDNVIFMQLFGFDQSKQSPLQLMRAGWQIHAVFGEEALKFINRLLVK